MEIGHGNWLNSNDKQTIRARLGTANPVGNPAFSLGWKPTRKLGHGLNYHAIWKSTPRGGRTLSTRFPPGGAPPPRDSWHLTPALSASLPRAPPPSLSSGPHTRTTLSPRRDRSSRGWDAAAKSRRRRSRTDRLRCRRPPPAGAKQIYSRLRTGRCAPRRAGGGSVRWCTPSPSDDVVDPTGSAPSPRHVAVLPCRRPSPPPSLSRRCCSTSLEQQLSPPLSTTASQVQIASTRSRRRLGFLLQKICRYLLQESYVFLTTSLEFVQIKIGQCNLMCSYASYFDSLSIS
jgi:hypothetical protein